MRKCIIAGVAVILNAFAAHGATNLISNGDFGSFTGNNPDSWTKNLNVVTTQVSGLDGGGSAVQLGITTTGNNQSALRQNLSSQLGATFSLQFDFQILTTGNVPTAGARTLSFTLRPAGGTTPILTGRALFDGSANNGAIQFFDGSAFQSITGQTELVNLSDIYRLVITGDLDATTPFYDVSLFNVTDNTSAGGQAGVTNFQSSATQDIAELTFERGRSERDYIVDNVYFGAEPIPEPGVSLLGLLGSGLILRRRR